MKKRQYLSILFLTLVTLLPFQVQAKKYQYETYISPSILRNHVFRPI